MQQDTRPNILALFEILGSIVIAWVVMTAFAGINTRFDELALDSNTTSVYGSIDAQQVHCQGTQDVSQCESVLANYPWQQRWLWLGNSQLHAVNQYQQGQETSSVQLHRLLAVSRLGIVSLSQPNANLEEHLVWFAHFQSNQKIDGLVLPLVFDDTREIGLRDDLSSVIQLPVVRQKLSAFEVGRELADQKMDTKEKSPDSPASGRTLQDRSEEYLEQFLISETSAWKARPELRGQIFAFLYQFRNYALGIKPNTVRSIIHGRYSKNMQALEAIFKLASTSGTRVVAYIAPIRHDVPIPYDSIQYANYKSDCQKLASKYGQRLIDLDDLIPAQYWGTKGGTNLGDNSEIDFMHFQAAGHKILASRLAEEIHP